MTLLNPTDRELDAAFAEHVAGWRLWPRILLNDKWHIVPTWVAPPFAERANGIAPIGQCLGQQPPNFTQSADAVLPWLQGWYCSAHWFCGAEGAQPGWRVDIEANPIDKTPGVSAHSKTLPRAAVLALLRAHGVEIQFTPTPK